MRLLTLAGLWLASVGVAAQGNEGSVISPKEQPVSGYRFLTPETRALQDDAFANPGPPRVPAAPLASLGEPTTYGNSRPCFHETRCCSVVAAVQAHRAALSQLKNTTLWEYALERLIFLQQNYSGPHWDIIMHKHALKRIAFA